jgi:hypothetical protein
VQLRILRGQALPVSRNPRIAINGSRFYFESDLCNKIPTGRSAEQKQQGDNDAQDGHARERKSHHAQSRRSVRRLVTRRFQSYSGEIPCNSRFLFPLNDRRYIWMSRAGLRIHRSRGSCSKPTYQFSRSTSFGSSPVSMNSTSCCSLARSIQSNSRG